MKEGKWKSDIFVQSGFFFFFLSYTIRFKEPTRRKKTQKTKNHGPRGTEDPIKSSKTIKPTNSGGENLI